jgi:hypothetical protein
MDCLHNCLTNACDFYLRTFANKHSKQYQFHQCPFAGALSQQHHPNCPDKWDRFPQHGTHPFPAMNRIKITGWVPHHNISSTDVWQSGIKTLSDLHCRPSAYDKQSNEIGKYAPYNKKSISYWASNKANDIIRWPHIHNDVNRIIHKGVGYYQLKWLEGWGTSAVFTLCSWRCVVILAKYRNGVENQTPILCCSLHQAQIQMSIILVIGGVFMNFLEINM